MRNPAGALLAVPVFVAVRLASLVRRSTVARAGLALATATVLGVGIVGAGSPTATEATPPSPVVPLTQAAFRTTVATDHALTDPVAITFSTPMNQASVRAALDVEPPTPVDLRWDAAGKVVTISPRMHWEPGTFHTISVRPGALARSGQPLTRATRAVFITRPATTGELIATDRVGDRVSPRTAFQVSFAGPVDATTVATAVHLDPPAPGSLVVRSTGDGESGYTFVPSGPLRADVRYRVTVSGVLDPDGLPLEALSLTVRTLVAPAVVDLSPVADAIDVATDAAVSVRFSQPMDRPSTAAALKVSIAGKPVAGTVGWAGSDTVLVFTPTSPLPYDATVVADVDATAQSATGVSLEAPRRAIFRTVTEPPAPTPATAAAATRRAHATKTATTKAPNKAPSTGGAAVGGGSWAAIETYYLGLMNCTRTGGWVTSSGTCSSPGGRDVAPLKLDPGISSKVSRPYAKRLATGNLCNHFIGGSPANRLTSAGFTSYRWAENLGCRSGDPRSAVLGSHLFFQSERSYSGGHYVNLMNPAYDRVGIGVWVASGRVRLVIDFYHP